MTEITLAETLVELILMQIYTKFNTTKILMAIFHSNLHKGNIKFDEIFASLQLIVACKHCFYERFD